MHFSLLSGCCRSRILYCFVGVGLVHCTIVLVLVEEEGSRRGSCQIKYLARTSVVGFRSFFNNIYLGGFTLRIAKLLTLYFIILVLLKLWE